MKVNAAGIADKLKEIKFNKKTAIFLSAILVVIIGTVTICKVRNSKNENDSANKTQFTILAKTNVFNMVSSSGAIQSGESTNVYSNFNDSYTLQEVNVEVGDEVKKGDVLAVIDTSDFEDEIEQLETTVAANEKKSQLTLDEKKKAYEDELYLYENDCNSSVVNAKAAVESSRLSLDNTQRIYEYYKMLNENGEASDQELRLKEIDYENAKNDYTKAEVSLESAKISAEQSLRNAKNDYENALASYKDDSERKKLEAKKAQLKNREVIAPCDGTITSVNVEVGDKCGSGAFFVIQNLKNLIVNVDVDETEIADVEVGQKVQVTTDASGDEILQGEVVSVDPISTSVANGSSNGSGSTSAASTNSTSSDVTFTVKVQINNYNELVKVGMNAVVNIIVSEADNVYAVPYEAIRRQENQFVIYVAEKDGDKYVAKSIAVERGLESDVYVEISGKELKDGMIVLSDSSAYKDGDIVDVQIPERNNIKAGNQGSGQESVNMPSEGGKKE